jgi:two-component system response regulator NreC
MSEPPPDRRVRVVLADDHTLVRTGVRALLEAANIEVVGDVCDGAGAIRLCAELAPDVAILDVGMPGLSGIDAARAIREANPHVRIIMLSMYADRQYVAEALKAGASSYLLKDAAFSELLTAVEVALSGGVHLAPEVSRTAAGDASHGDVATILARLSARERQVLQLVAESKTNSEIARILHISPHTVDTHRRNVMEKLDLHSVVDLVKFAIRYGLASVD